MDFVDNSFMFSNVMLPYDILGIVVESLYYKKTSWQTNTIKNGITRMSKYFLT